MLCSFGGPPRIVRLHGRGEVLLPDHDDYAPLMAAANFEDPAVPEAWRSIVRVEISRIAESCGYGVPLLSYEGERPHSAAWARKKLRTGGQHALADYVAEKNARSIDGLPAVDC
jgi:hypothetical protein